MSSVASRGSVDLPGAVAHSSRRGTSLAYRAARFWGAFGIVFASLAAACGNHSADSGDAKLSAASPAPRPSLIASSTTLPPRAARVTSRQPRLFSSTAADYLLAKADERVVAAFSERPQQVRLAKRNSIVNPPESPSLTTPDGAHGVFPDAGPLSRFQAKLAALKRGERQEPVVILHLGDSHVAADGFSRGIRRRLQNLYGDAGRGAVIPPDVFQGAGADGVSLSRSGEWSAVSSLKTNVGPFGLSGVRISSSAKDAALVLESKSGPFDFAEVTLVTGPSAGGVTLKVGTRSQSFSAKAPRPGSTTVRLDARGSTLTVHPAGDGTTQILYWATGRNRPGIRYVNFGLVGATVDVTRRWDAAIVANDIKALKPDLIVYGYATNEGFDDALDLERYRAYASSFVARLKRDVPDADFAFVGAADGLRHNGVAGGVVRGAARGSSGESCGADYRTPPKLAGIRRTVAAMAKSSGSHFWDWSQMMGGRCAIDGWAQQGLAAKDRVHLTKKGYDLSAQAFFESLLPASNAAVALRN